ncbi:hypothetical protein ACWKWJ_13075 [Sphingopyxis terrae subsp. ummariensis]
MNDYQCWFCGEGIARADKGAVIVNIASLWFWDAGSRHDDRPSQDIYAHSRCTKEQMRGATMSLDPSVLGEGD